MALQQAPSEATTTAIEGLEHQFAVMFSKVRNEFRERATKVHPDLAPAAYTVLAALVRSGPRHAGTLAAELFIDKSVMSRIVKQLLELQLVERRPDPDDGRAYYLAASPVAVQRVNDVRGEYRKHLHDLLADWAEADIRQFTALLARLNEEV